MADPKAFFEISKEASKVLAKHPVYGRVLIVFKQAELGWYYVVWDDAARKPQLGGELRLSDVALW